MNYAQVFPNAFVAFSSLGLTNIMITRLVQKTENSETDLLGTGFTLKLLSGSLCYAIATGGAYFIYKDDYELQILIYLLSVVLIFQSFDVIDMFFQANVLTKHSVWAKTLAFAISSSLKLYFLIVHASLTAFAITMVLELLLGTIFLCWFYKVQTGISVTKWKFKFLIAEDLLKTSWPLIISDLLIFTYMRLDQFMIQQMVGSKELGIYSAALRLSEAWYFLSFALTNSFYPSIAILWHTNQEKFYENYQKLITRLTALSTFVAFGISVLAPFLVQFIYGSNYYGVSPILAIHVWTGLPIFLGVGCSNLYILKNLQKFNIVRSLTGAAINIILNYWLIPLYGALGASYATFVSQLFASVLLNAFFSSTRPILLLQLRAIRNVFSLNMASIR